MSNERLIELTGRVVTAYVEGGQLAPNELPELIRKVHAALASAGSPPSQQVEASRLTAADIRRSIRPDALISFEDGRPYKQLRRHLTSRGMTVQEYKEKWGLPADYPTVAPSYSAKRSEMAKQFGLGRNVAGRQRGRG